MPLGAGSRSSPIFISDDEDDSYSPDIEILSPPTRSKTLHTQGRPAKPKKAPTHQVTKQQPTPETSSKKRKRKREQSNAPGHRQAHNGGPGPSSHKNKRAKQDRPKNNLRYEPSDVPYSGDPYMASLPPRPFTYATEDIPYYSFPSTNDHDDYNDDDSPLLSSSEWVNSMVRAAKPPIEDFAYTSPPPRGYVSEHTPDPMPVEPGPSASTSAVTLEASTSLSSETPSPKKPPPSNVIGMPIERDPDGKRGSFKITQSTIFEAQPSVTFPHVPHPPKTLIMEQLPKTHRTFSFVQSWCEKACGSSPSFYAIEASAAKALVELPSVALAKKAWGSPKLGKGLSGLNSVQLKGKPREDLIRVWWYQPPSPEPVFVRKELEEGEIEDEAAVDDVTPRETKKERKARLAKAQKEEKAKKREKARAAAEALQKEKAQAQAQTRTITPSTSSTSTYSLPSLYSDPYDPSMPIMMPPMYMPLQYPPNPPPPPPPLQPTWFVPPMPSSLPPPLPPPLPESHSHWHSPPGDPYFDVGMGDYDDPINVDDDTMDIDDLDMDLSSPVETTRSIISQPPDPSDPVDLPEDSPLLPPKPFARVNVITPSEPYRVLPTPTPTPPNEPMSMVSGVGKSSATCPSAPTLSSSSAITAPSEPRAMKNAPREPSFAKRSLLARQKELEERILKSKLELERKQAVTSVIRPASAQSQSEPQPELVPDPIASVPSSSSVSDVGLGGVPDPIASVPSSSSVSDLPDAQAVDDSPSKKEMEENLRQLVLASQKRRKAAAAAAAANSASPPVLSTSTVPPMARPPSAEASLTQSPIVEVPKSSLDDLAVSFINETFQTLQPGPSSASPKPPTPTSTLSVSTPVSVQAPKPIPASASLPVPVSAPVKPPLPSNPTSTSTSLAAKRLQLEQNIAETKRLMEKLSKATTKQERDSTLARIREISRNTTGEDNNSGSRPGSAPSTPAPAPISYPSFLTASVKSPWPDSVLGGGILILSDDEDDDDEDGVEDGS
ncbi:hypothetical protein VKT23_007401 [Stygiomarasmius scandens]|uniref:Uncharacterized protein n=1 Tax=Marasmiellus scandens TaxID=2682957 RepID=A0ABR1JKK3_9AGAR